VKDAELFTDFKECMRKCDFDAVMIFTPDYAHAEIAVPALKSGKFVFVEKPLETTDAKCRRIIEADRKAGGRTYVGHNLRHAPLYGKIKSMIDKGDIGRILTIQADEFYDGGRTYFRRWNRFRKFGGGLWITKACHDFDVLQWLAGARPVSVSAVSALSYYRRKKGAAEFCGDCRLRKSCFDAFEKKKYPKAWYDHIMSAVPDGMPRPDICLYNSDKDTFDHGAATVRFENDIFATYTVNVVSGFTNRTIRISGTRGTIDGNLEEQRITQWFRDPPGKKSFNVIDPSTAGAHGGADSFVVSDFLSFVRGEKRPKVAPAEAHIAVRIGLAAEKSSSAGKIIPMQEEASKR